MSNAVGAGPFAAELKATLAVAASLTVAGTARTAAFECSSKCWRALVKMQSL